MSNEFQSRYQGAVGRNGLFAQLSTDTDGNLTKVTNGGRRIDGVRPWRPGSAKGSHNH